MRQVQLETTQIGEFVEDFIKYSSSKPIRWFMGKYGITYDEYSYLSFAAAHAESYKTTAQTVNRRLNVMIQQVQKQIITLQDYMTDHRIDPVLQRSVDKLIEAVQRAKKEYSDDYMNDLMKELKYE